MIKSIVMAFSTYSRVPMPRIEWDEKHMKYNMCFFPCVGILIGLIQYLVIWVYYRVNGISCLFASVVLSVLPLLITGGIHMDGYMDTIDAKNSYKSVEEKLKILKDPHTGAFAIIYAIIYMVIYIAAIVQLLTISVGEDYKRFFAISISFVLSRILSGISVVTFKKAKKDGMLASTAEMSHKKVYKILVVELVICVAILVLLGGLFGIVASIAAGIVFLYYRYMAYRNFGGITGDLAGYFLCICELIVLLSVAVLTIFV